ncbi:hypothetical protein PMI10_02385 [Flavobacterium sp. CF136]|nr:hypothetical protein PMI10_02385 [Flavobacterium sp. CF136]
MNFLRLSKKEVHSQNGLRILNKFMVRTTYKDHKKIKSLKNIDFSGFFGSTKSSVNMISYFQLDNSPPESTIIYHI